jgi:alkylglycerol monooxygenase
MVHTRRGQNHTMSKAIVFATPIFLLLIALEYAWGRSRVRKGMGMGKDTYRLDDAISSIGLGMLSQLTGILTKALQFSIYVTVFESAALWRNDAFWGAWYGVLLALLMYDFFYYWLHRGGHEVAVLWAAHVVHHQSQTYNLSTALRQTGSGNLLGWIFYLPMALAGVPPLIFGIVYLIDLLYQFWVHTEHVPKLGWFDRVFCSPSNHRVHHAVNDPYVDKNYGGVLILWDRLFGTFREEDEPCVYGTRSPLNSWDPLWANAEVYWTLMKESWHARHWGDKLRLWFKPPGWQSAEMAQRTPKAPFDMALVPTFHPPMRPAVAWFAATQLVVLLGGIALFLWEVDALPLAQAGVWCAALTAGLWALGAVMQGRLGTRGVLIVEAAVLAIAMGMLSLIR